MPRLLLVDDNQRIHQIAATLLHATDIELICASSGAEALDILAGGGTFDAALVDTTMQGMDGWELLARLRGSGPTATLPVAMMAGVLEGVDDETVRKAPIQAFLKKPVELRSDLPDRIRALIATPVTPAEPEPAAAPEVAAGPGPAEFLPLQDRDLLILGPEDLLLEDPAEAAAEATEALPHLDSLELEELDLESLRELNPPAPAPEESSLEARTEITSLEEVGDLPDFSLEDTLTGEEPETGLLTGILPDLGPGEPAAPAAPEMPLPENWSDESETLLDLPGDSPWPAPSWSGPADFGPDSFLEQEEGADPTPAFVPEEPGMPTPLRVPNPFADALERVPPQAITIHMEDELPAGEKEAAEPLPATPVAREFSPVDVELMAEEVFPLAADSAPAAAFAAAEPAEPQVAAVHPEPEAAPVHPEPEVAAIHPEPEVAAIHPEPGVAAIHPEPGVAAVHPEPEVATVHPEPEVAAVHPEPEVAAVHPEPGVAPAPAAPLPVGAAALDAVLADPELMDRLARAVVARLGDKILREIAWEVMPEMADRLHRN